MFGSACNIFFLLSTFCFAGPPELVEARKKYRETLEAARLELVAEYDAAIATAKRTGEAAEVNRLTAEKDRLVGSKLSPREKFEKKLEGSRWRFKDQKDWMRFKEDNEAINHQGTHIAWFAFDANTVVIQSHRTSRIYVMQFNEQTNEVTRTAFKKVANSAKFGKLTNMGVPAEPYLQWLPAQRDFLTATRTSVQPSATLT